MSHKPAQALHKAENASETGPRSPSTAGPQQLPPSPADSSKTVVPTDREILPSSRLEAELKGLRHNIATVDEELARFDSRLSGATTYDERRSLKEKRQVFEQRRKVLEDREAFFLRKIAILSGVRWKSRGTRNQSDERWPPPMIPGRSRWTVLSTLEEWWRTLSTTLNSCQNL